jgi:aerobic carbon-monoxide dehydrogenase medium subunit
MRPFLLDEASDLEDALQLLSADADAHLIAGGTSVMLLMHLGLMEPSHLISLRRVDELRGISATADGGLEIKAMTTHRQLETAPEVQRFCPALTETFRDVATVRIRNQGTIGGNLAHADPAQDPPPMLIALGAEVVLKSASCERRVRLEELATGYLSTVIQPDEILTEIHVPPLAAGTHATYIKFLPRTHDDYATVSVAATLRMNGDRCENVRLALGSVAPTPLRLHEVEDAVRGQPLTDAAIAAAASMVPGLVDPPDDARGSAAYKRRMAGVWTERALRKLRDQSNGAVHP